MAGARPVWTSDERTMAQETANSRWPKIVSGMIDDIGVEIAVSSNSLPRRDEGREIVQQLNALKEEIKNDAHLRYVAGISTTQQSAPLTQLRPFESTAEPDVAGYNKQLGDGGEYSWRKAPWLFAECYLYR